MTSAELTALTEAAAKIERSAQQLSAPRTPAPTGDQRQRTEDMLNSQQPPAVTKSLNTEKPFSLHRFLAGYKHKNEPSICPHEIDVLNRYSKALVTTGCAIAGVSGGLWLPTDINEDYGGQLTSTAESEKDYAYVKAVLDATRPHYDPDEAAWLERRRYVKAQSAFQDALGGSLIAPPVQGAVLPLIRPNASILAAGAQAVTLPPNGRMVFPRITGAPDVQAVGEGQETPESDMTTGQMELTAKKIAGAVRMTEEASAYSSGTMDAIAQAELGRSFGLRMDAYAYYGIGSTHIPAGLTSNTYTGNGTTTGVLNVATAHPTAKGIGANGNTLRPEYGDILPALIEERSFGVEDGVTGAWVMRPAVYAVALARRADAVVADDQAGTLVDMHRRFSEGAPNVFRGRRVVRTTNLRNNGTKGTGTGLSDAFFGVWRYAIMATYKAINFSQGHNGVTFMQGQSLIRGVMFGDIGFQYPEAFLWFPDALGITGSW